jgi:hypothetical protein
LITQEAELCRIIVQNQTGQKVNKDPLPSLISPNKPGMVDHACNPSEDIGRRIAAQGQAQTKT